MLIGVIGHDQGELWNLEWLGSLGRMIFGGAFQTQMSDFKLLGSRMIRVRAHSRNDFGFSLFLKNHGLFVWDM